MRQNIPGELIGIAKRQYLQEMRVLSDHQQLQTRSGSVAAMLRNCGVKGIIDYKRNRKSIFQDYLIIQYDSSGNADEIVENLNNTGLFAKVIKREWTSRIAFGCYPRKYSSDEADPCYLDPDASWWIRTQLLYSDEDLSQREAWEFTRSDSSIGNL